MLSSGLAALGDDFDLLPHFAVGRPPPSLPRYPSIQSTLRQRPCQSRLRPPIYIRKAARPGVGPRSATAVRIRDSAERRLLNGRTPKVVGFAPYGVPMAANTVGEFLQRAGERELAQDRRLRGVNLASEDGPDGFANGKPTMSDRGPDQAGAIVCADRVLEALDPAAPGLPY